MDISTTRDVEVKGMGALRTYLLDPTSRRGMVQSMLRRMMRRLPARLQQAFITTIGATRSTWPAEWQCVTVCHMDQVGMRELRHRLREYLARVEAGERFEVTVFGRPVARLAPVATTGPTLARLIEDGQVTPPLHADTSRLPPLSRATTGTGATEALLTERGADSR